MKVKLILSCRHCGHLRLGEVHAERYECFKTKASIENIDGKIQAGCPLWSIGEFVEATKEHFLESDITTKRVLRLEDDGTPKRHGRQTK